MTKKGPDPDTWRKKKKKLWHDILSSRSAFSCKEKGDGEAGPYEHLLTDQKVYEIQQFA